MEDPLESRRSEVDALFSAALDLPPDRRDAFLEEACCEDVPLRQAVEKLLQGSEREDLFLDPRAARRGGLRQRLASPLESAMRSAETPLLPGQTSPRDSKG